MVPELLIFPLLLDRKNYNTYRSSINLSNAKQNMKEIYGLYLTLDKLMGLTTTNTVYSLDEFTAYYWHQHPMIRKEEREIIEGSIFQPLLVGRNNGEIYSPEFAENILVEIHSRASASKIALMAYDVSVGKAEFSSLVEAIKEVPSKENVKEDEFVTDDLNVLLDKAVVGGGLRWRLESLNTRLGPLRRGNFGAIFGRPEVGKTTLLASEVTKMAEQTEGPILWFNNEEDGSIIQLRCYQASLGRDLPYVLSNREECYNEYRKNTKCKLKIFDGACIKRSDVERLCNTHKPSLVVLDKIDFISGFDAERKDLVLEAIYRWARELSKEFCPVLGVCHADGAAEGLKYITMDHMDNAKTAKQATCDWILGIGQEHREGMDYVRGFYLSKNKLMGDENTDPRLRHDKWNVLIAPDIARFSDVVRNR